MLSEHRLHPVSILFALSGSLKAFALPALLLIFSSLRRAPVAPVTGPEEPTGWLKRWPPFGSDVDGWQIWLLLFLVVAVVGAVLRYLTFRLTYEDTELVIRSGLLFRNERHVPYERIQNLDATRSVVHRLFNVAEVRLETGGGHEPEARISVLRETEFDEMRRRVFEGRTRTGSDPVATDTSAVAPEVDTPSPALRPLLYLPLRELLLLGLLDNRGFLLIAAAYGVLWESGYQSVLWEGFSARLSAPGALSTIRESLKAGNLPSFGLLFLMAGGLLGVVLGVRLLSMAWVTVNLHDFRLSRAGEDLRTEYGLFTRVTTTIPRRRIQSLTVRETPLHRWIGRSSVLVRTAGGSANAQPAASRPRERLAPIIHSADVPDLMREVMPDADLDSLIWQPLHPRAFGRAVKPLLAVYFALAPSLLLVASVRHWQPALALVAAGTVAVVAIARRQMHAITWASDDHVVALRSGWLWRTVTVAPVGKIQSVTATESPFDRRASMAAVGIDTAGGIMAVPVLRIPYLGRETALELAASLSTKAAQTTFRW
jgi:putative membrane protein